MNTRATIMVRTATIATAAALASAAGAQTCGPHWLPGHSNPGMTGGAVRAVTTWDADGPGGQDPLTIVAGSFTGTPGGPANRIAAWDRTTNTWTTLGAGLSGTVNALAVMPNGDLVAAGIFTSAGGNPASRIARWNGKTWSTFGSGMNSTVSALAVMPNGDLVAGGSFATAGGVTVNKIGRWDGAQWNAMDGGIAGASQSVRALCVRANGDLIVGGEFSNPGGYSFAFDVARWDGTWHAVATGFSGSVAAIAETTGGDLYIGGNFNVGPGFGYGVARLNPSGGFESLDFSVMSDSTPADYVNSLCALPDGGLLVGGDFTSIAGNDIPAAGLGRWDGSAWHSVGVSGLGTGSLVSEVNVRAIGVMPDGDVFIGGDFGAADNIPAFYGATLDTAGNTLGALAPGMNGNVYAMTFAPNGDLIIGGAFTGLDGISAPRVARWDGANWSAMGAGFDDAVDTLFTGSDGTIYAGGRMTMSGEEYIGFISKWTGTEWFRVGTTAFVSEGGGNTIHAIAEMHNGDIVAGGQFVLLDDTGVTNIARFDGVQWNAMGAGLGGNVWTLCTMPNGDIIAGGSMGEKAMRWNGSAWSSIGATASGAAYASVVMPNGDLILGGSFTNLAGNPACDRIARWDGVSWSPLGTGMAGGSLPDVQDLIVLPNGNLLAVGGFTSAGGKPANRIAVWNGTSWSAGYAGGFDSAAYIARSLPTGELVVGGLFSNAGGISSGRFARWTDTGIPGVALNPESQIAASGDTVTLNAVPTAGYEGVSVQWQRNGVNIVDGPGGASFGGGTVSGASATLASPTDGSLATLTITGAQPSDAGDYTAVFANTCGEVETLVAQVVIDGEVCAADFNNDGTVNSTDVSDFVNQWFQDQVDETLLTDWDNNGVINSTDVSDFINAWFEDTAAGCGG